MEIRINPDRSRWAALAERVTAENPEIEARVRVIIDRVRQGGDEALKAISKEIDGFTQESLKVSEAGIEEACKAIDPKVKAAIDRAYDNIYAFHKAEVPQRIEVQTAPGVTCIQKPVPIGSVGLYIPGGTAPLFSTVLMLGVPSLIAGCPRRTLCTPVGSRGRICPELLYSAWKCGIRDIWKIGGAQAIAAMAYGTESIPKADKIFGPGNRYVTTAKQLVSGRCASIDMPAGPSEVMVLADSQASPAFVAADLLSQAEHGTGNEKALLVTDSKDLADAVDSAIHKFTLQAPRKKLIQKVADNGGLLIALVSDMDRGIELIRQFAPEHFEIMTSNPDAILPKVRNTGAVFVGKWTPESAGDFAAGPSHVLPTGGSAKRFSGLTVDDFRRRTSLVQYTESDLRDALPVIEAFGAMEGLDAHARSARIRFGK